MKSAGHKWSFNDGGISVCENCGIIREIHFKNHNHFLFRGHVTIYFDSSGVRLRELPKCSNKITDKKTIIK